MAGKTCTNSACKHIVLNFGCCSCNQLSLKKDSFQSQNHKYTFKKGGSSPLLGYCHVTLHTATLCKESCINRPSAQIRPLIPELCLPPLKLVNRYLKMP